jgi:hypothetical protein
MQENVFVEYVASRTVYVDGTKCGETNEVFLVETGTHTFDLGKPVTYTPPAVTLQVKNTTPLDPLVITFQPEL